jgi:hypothetical protein
MMNVQRLLLSALLLVATLLSSANAFSPAPKTFRLPTRVQVLDSYDYPGLQDTSETSSQEKRSLPSWVNLPNRVTDETPDLFNAELSVGRVAMLGAVGLILKEVVSGESVLEQFSGLVHSLN